VARLTLILLIIATITYITSITDVIFCRQLAQNQVGWFKRDPLFHWVNIAPGGERLALSEVAIAVKEWFLHDTPLPQLWDGSCLQTLVR
jgi:hypothetical protein